MKKILVLILFFYSLALLQTSFFPHFNIFGITPNIILIAVIFLILFSPYYFPDQKKWLGVGSALVGGFFLDVFSSQPIGWNILILVSIAIFVQIIFRKYVRSSIY